MSYYSTRRFRRVRFHTRFSFGNESKLFFGQKNSTLPYAFAINHKMKEYIETCWRIKVQKIVYNACATSCKQISTCTL